MSCLRELLRNIAAIRAALLVRPVPRNPDDQGLFFVTKYGNRWVRTEGEKQTPINSVGLEFGKLLKNSEFQKAGVAFYAFSHTFRTIADSTKTFQPPGLFWVMRTTAWMGDAINYLLKRWEPLTLFLRKAGAPLDNNLCERALKKAIMHRKNSMFYKTRNGARVGDMYMSVIYTCALSGANAFDYLNQLQLSTTDVTKSPDRWMPWNYRDNVQPVSDTG